MTSENSYTQELVKGVRARLKKAVTFRHTDLFTKGVPDFSVTRGGVTSWFEAKYLDDSRLLRYENGDAFVVVRPTLHVPLIQWENLRLLLYGYLVVYTPAGHALTHVSGKRETVGQMKLRLMPTMVNLANAVVKAAEGSKENTWW
jgi:hypothetical protein